MGAVLQPDVVSRSGPADRSNRAARAEVTFRDIGFIWVQVLGVGVTVERVQGAGYSL